jgi:hypothetical protein
MAALWRAFLILGNPLCRIPDKEKGMLRELQDLYQRHISTNNLRFVAAGGPTEGDGQGNTRRNDAAPPDFQERSHQFPTSAGSAASPSRNADNSTKDCNGGESLADSAIDVRSCTSERQITVAQINLLFPKQRTTNTKVYAEQQSRQERKNTSYTLPCHRPHLQPRQELWRWGPSSTSEMKLSLFHKIMRST